MSYNYNNTNKDYNPSNILDLEEGEISNELINPEKKIIDEGKKTTKKNEDKTVQGEGQGEEEGSNKDDEEQQNFFHKMMQVSNEKDYSNNISNEKSFLKRKREKSQSPNKDFQMESNRQGNINNNNTMFFQKKPCQYYMNGFCTKGKFCKFSHDTYTFNNSTNSNSSSINTNYNSKPIGTFNKQNNTGTATYSQLKNLKRDLCKYFVNGKCLKGDNCTFSHTIKDFPCKSFQLTGICEDEENCKFLHKKLNQEEMMKFIKDNEAAILEQKQKYKSTKIDAELKMYLENKLTMQNNMINNNPPNWKSGGGAYPPSNNANTLPINMNMPLMGANMIQQQKTMIPQFPMYSNIPFTMPFVPFFGLNNSNMMIPNQFNIPPNTQMSPSLFPPSLPVDQLNNKNPYSNEGVVNNDKNIDRDPSISNTINNNNDQELNTSKTNIEIQKANGTNMLNQDKELKKESKEDLFQKIVEAIKQKAPQDPRIRNKQ